LYKKHIVNTPIQKYILHHKHKPQEKYKWQLTPMQSKACKTTLQFLSCSLTSSTVGFKKLRQEVTKFQQSAANFRQKTCSSYSKFLLCLRISPIWEFLSPNFAFLNENFPTGNKNF